MANISDVYDIEFQCETQVTAKILQAYLVAIDKMKEKYYETLNEPERDGSLITGAGVMGRWSYQSNFEGSFFSPQTWFGTNFEIVEKQWDALTERLINSGEEIIVGWSEDETGCEFYAHGSGSIWANEKTEGEIAVDVQYEEKDRPDCDIELWEESPYCHWHDQKTSDVGARWCDFIMEDM